jgi:predicted NAD/FAD-dependent oxidoreductase
VTDAQLMRWRYAQPTTSHDARCLVAVDGSSPLVCAGDAFAEAKVEGAARSGWDAAGAVLDRLT